MIPKPITAMIAAAIFSLPHAAQADPCTAIPDRGPMPLWLKPGTKFTGPVVYVGDGDGLCVAAVPGREGDPGTWVEVRLADFYAVELHQPGGAEAKAVLDRITHDQALQCTAGRRSYDRVVATCTLLGRPLGALLSAAGSPEGGRGR